jgi:predicted transcriptional regulator
MNQPIHILNQTGILTSFSVAKKITESEITKYYSRHKRTKKNSKKIGEMLKNKIVEDIQKAVRENKIPGLISQQEIARNLGMNEEIVKALPELNDLISDIITVIAAEKYDKMVMCYIVNSLVNMLNLTEEDFTKFHEQNNNDTDGDDQEPV